MSSILEKSFGHRDILLRDEEGNLLSARVELGCKDWTEDKRRHTECRIKLIWSDGEIE